jgi:hypothetical protein
MRLSRRTLLGASLALIAVPARAFSRDDQATLAQLAYDLFPHPRLGLAPYRTIAAGLMAQVQPEPRRAAWRNGLALLDSMGRTPWRLRPAAQRLQALTAASRLPVFADWRASIAIGLYNTPANAKRLGFPGPSLEFGGYLDKGFGDLAWLPEPKP